MDPDAPWQGSQNAAARKAVETTDAAWPTMVRRSLMAEEAMTAGRMDQIDPSAARPRQ
jgi:hypothetical protein